MKKLLNLLVLLSITSLSAQKDTLYFNSAWNKTTKAEAAYFRPMPLKKVGNLYQVKDFYSNGTLQMEGFWSNIEKEVFEGKAIWYYENGQPFQVQEYKYGLLNGISTYHTVDGFLRAKGEYRSGGMWTGTFQRLCCPGAVTEYVDGQRTAELTFYQGSAQLAKKEIYKNNTVAEIVFFDRKGQRIGQITYKDNEALNGTFIGFYMDDNQATRAISIKNSIAYKDGLREGELIEYDKKGIQIAKGLCKNDQPWQGSFYLTGGLYNEITTYEEGIKDGPYFEYAHDGKLLKQQEYKNGELSGFSKTAGAFENKICECEFKDGKPFIGEVCEDVEIKKYKDGTIVEVELYSEEPEPVLKTRTLFEDSKKVKETSYHNDKKFEVTYKDYKPYNGVTYSFLNEASTTYVDGEKHGEFLNNQTSYYAITMSGNYVKGALDGAIIFKDSELNKTTICIYEKGIPVSGVAMFKKDYITTYKNGKKHGLETSLRGNTFSSKPVDSISRNYAKGKLEGAIEFYKNGELMATGVYKNDMPYSGVFYDVSKGTVQYMNEYAQGVLIKHELHFRDIMQSLSYSNGKKRQSKFYNKEQLIAEGLYKKNQPYEGGFAELEIIDPHYYHERYTLSHYKKGKRNGEERVVNFKENKIEKITAYRKNKKEREVNFTPFQDKDSIVGVYKNGFPFSGDFIVENPNEKVEKNTISTVNHYENGQKSGLQYYAVKGSRFKIILDSISYVKGKPFDGVELEEQDGGVVFQHFYKKGKLTETHIHIFGVDNSPNNKIIYNANGFTTYYVSKKEYLKQAAITYTNSEKTEGTTTLFKNDTEIGSFKFSDTEITAAQISYQDGNTQIDIQMDASNNALVRIETPNELMKLKTRIRWNAKASPVDFIQWDSLFFRADATAYCYLNDKETLISTFTYKDGKAYEGVVTRINDDGTYTYRKYKSGEMIEKKADISEEQLIALMKE